MAEPGEQRVSCGMPVGVVVDLEAVQVEQHEGCLGLLHCREVGEQPAAVAEPREGVGGGIDGAGADHPEVLLEDERHPRDYRDDAGGREHEREHVHVAKVAVDEDRETDSAEAGRKDERTPGLNADVGDRRPLPGSECDERRGEHPTRVEDRALPVRVIGDLHEVGRVGDREEQAAGHEQCPTAAEPPRTSPSRRP